MPPPKQVADTLCSMFNWWRSPFIIQHRKAELRNGWGLFTWWVVSKCSVVALRMSRKYVREGRVLGFLRLPRDYVENQRWGCRSYRSSGSEGHQ